MIKTIETIGKSDIRVPTETGKGKWSWKIKNWSWKSHGKTFCQVCNDTATKIVIVNVFFFGFFLFFFVLFQSHFQHS